MNKTIWKDIKGYEGLYQVSNKGEVKSLVKGTLMKPFDNGRYLRIGLYKEGKQKKFLIHRLVAETFIPRIAGKPQVNHRDLDTKNNSVENLEWVDGKENVRHAIDNISGRAEYLKSTMSEVGKEHYIHGVQASKKSVKQIDINSGETLNIFESAREAGRRTGSRYKNISQVCKGQKKTHNGYKWEFV